MTRIAVNGVNYNVEESGWFNYAPRHEKDATESPLILLHGFTGSAASWQEHMAVLSRPETGIHRVIAIDLLGHGLSAAPDDPACYAPSVVTHDILAIVDSLNIEKFVLLGYSMGGRHALHIALDAPERVAALTLESATAGLKTQDERNTRIASDEELAAFIEREGVEKFVERWERLPLWNSQRDLPEAQQRRHHEQRLQNNPCGLANSLRGAGAGAQDSLWDRLPELNVPVLLIAGEHDPKYCDIAREMYALLPDSQLEIVPRVGHTVHLEDLRGFDSLVTQFLSTQNLTPPSPVHGRGDGGEG